MIEAQSRRESVLHRALQLISPIHARYGTLSMVREILIEYFDINGDIVTYNNGR